MKKIMMAATVLLTACMAQAQMPDSSKTGLPNTEEPTEVRHRNGIWYTPVLRPTVVNGMAVGVYAGPYYNDDTVQINGVSIDADPVPSLAVMFGSMALLAYSPQLIQAACEKKGIFAGKHMTSKDSIEKSNNEAAERARPVNVNIHGLSLGGGIIKRGVRMKGVAVNAAFGREKDMEGVEVSGAFNWHYRFRGLIIAAVNRVVTGNGMQVGIVNKCKDGKVVQLGLVNKIGNRITPIINFRLRRKDNVAG